MRLIETKRVHEIPIKIIKYTSFFKRFRGLMFRLKPIVNEGILIEPCNSIHMFFMFFPIDVVFLNKNNQIVYAKENVKPWTVIFPIKNAKSVLELPVGSISRYHIKAGSSINI
ncbi:DUF192 domain-containing protein [Bacillus sp. Marseille-P3661]|uniref:DUF192 domain-containing protein n=1 Tax=Bacillus sp. Marseille-P3661 TaxID=1936234 RepID=UPI0021557F21|nr:DUF192 domain-containing protein [Bacillus sp. Marseille-P3661]